MRALVQRVLQASVVTGNSQVGSIDKGLLVFLGVSKGDGEEDSRYLVNKVLNLRIFADADSHFERSALDVGAEFLIVSQFTLYADTRRGRRPDFTAAAPAQEAEQLYRRTVELFKESGLKVETGHFGEYMQVSLMNDGPVTILLDSADGLRPRRG